MYLPQPYSGIRKKRGIATLAQPRLWQSAIISCSFLLTISIYVTIAQVLKPGAFGSYLFVQWLASAAVPLIGAGVSTLASRQIVDIQSRESPRLVAGIFYFLWYQQHRSILLYSFVYIVLAGALIWLSGTSTATLLLLGVLATLPSLLSSVTGTTLRSLRRADLLTMLHLFGTLITLLLVLIATQVAGQPIETFQLAFALASTLTLILSVICVIRLLPLEKALQPGIFLKERLQHGLRHAWLPFLLDLIIWQRCELILLACWRDSAEVGFYAISSIISTNTMGLAPSLFSHWLFPFFLRYMPGHRSLNAYDAFIKTSCYLVFLSVSICTIMLVLMPILISPILGNAYLPIIRPLRILLIAAAFGSIATLSLTHLTRCSPKNTQYFNLSIAACKIALVIPLTATWGIMGTAIVSALAQIASALVAMIICKKMLMKHEYNPVRDIL